MHLPMPTRPNSTQDTFIRLLNVLKPGRLPYATTVAKYLFFLLLLLNARSLPLAWHLRVLRPAFAIRLRYLWVKLRTAMFMSRPQREKEEDRWLDGLCPVGQHPLDTVVSYQSWASVDDNDFYGHLSNSSYAKTCDAARFKAALYLFPMFFRAGGWMALAATHYHFIREIPMFASYQVQTSIHAWDEKWLYAVVKFVTKKDRKTSTKQKSQARSNPKSDDDASSGSEDGSTITNSMPLVPALAAAATVPGIERGELITTPKTPAELATRVTSSSSTTAEANKHAERNLPTHVSNGKLEFQEKLGGDVAVVDTVLHTVVVFQLCFKMGRITVPPAVAIAVNGLSASPGGGGGGGGGTSNDGASAYSRENPPPSFIQAKKLMSKPCGGSTKQLREFLKGGWRDVPAEQRWWEDALGGNVEVTRKARMDAMEQLRKGLEGARCIT